MYCPVWQKHDQRNKQGPRLAVAPPTTASSDCLLGSVGSSHSDLPPSHCRFAVPWLWAASLSSAASVSFLLSAHCPVTAPAFWTFSSHTPLVLTEEQTCPLQAPRCHRRHLHMSLCCSGTPLVTRESCLWNEWRDKLWLGKTAWFPRLLRVTT